MEDIFLPVIFFVLIAILFVIVIRDLTVGKYLKRFSVLYIMSYFGDEIVINNKLTLQLKEVDGFGEIIFLLDGEVVEKIISHSYHNNEYLTLRKVWRKDVKAALKQRYQLMKKQKGEERKREKRENKEFNERINKVYKK